MPGTADATGVATAESDATDVVTDGFAVEGGPYEWRGGAMWGCEVGRGPWKTGVL